eukprot:4739731-Prorocentrum_lima.AAC.1
MWFAECLGALPHGWAGLMVKLIPKKEVGSTRPIGLFRGVARLWGKVRQGTLRAWHGLNVCLLYTSDAADDM